METKKILKVEGMSCNHCKMAVEKAVGAFENVKNVVVNLDKKEAELTLGGAIDEKAIVAALKELDYEASF